MSVQHLTGPQLVQHLALVDLVETGPPHTTTELITELDRRYGAEAMERLAQHATWLRADPFEIVAAAFTEPGQVIATARGEAADADTVAAEAANNTNSPRRATASDQPAGAAAPRPPL